MSAVAESLLRAGRTQEAYEKAAEALATDPRNAECLHLMGLVQASRGEWASARDLLESAVSLRSDRASWWRDLGVTLIASARPRHAAAALRRAVDLSPDRRAFIYLAEALAASGAKGKAIEVIERARQGWPASAESEVAIGRIFESLHCTAHAIKAYRRSLRIDPQNADSCARLAELYRFEYVPSLAERYAARLAKLKEYDSLSLHLLAAARYDLGKLQSSLRAYRRALAAHPGAEGIYSHYLFTLLADPAQTGQMLRRAYEAWFHGSSQAKTMRARLPNSADPNRKLRLGLSSAEFNFCPSLAFLLPILRAHDRTQFELYCYCVSEVHDSSTEQFRKAADHWRELHGRTPEQAHRTIRADKIDILVDISGLDGMHALQVFALRAAPVQVAFPNRPSTSGCAEVDFILTDRYITPDTEAEQQYSEKSVYRISSGYITFEPPIASGVKPLPALRNGYLTFGVFQRPAKYHARFWDAVAAILLRCPRSRLLIQYASRHLDQPGSYVRKRHLQELAKRGITDDRVQFIGVRSSAEHLEAISTVDVALDTWPYNGHTTTCCCLWMGLPVVTLAGAVHASRVSFSILQHVGLPNWAATSIREYVETAVSNTQDLDALAALRSSLRLRVAESPICRPEIVTRGLEDAYRDMWRQWCATQRPAARCQIA
jgi:protein O-GlcNAc transferase